jgi:D-alanyl-D-alanine carboxypeptidase
MKKLFLFVIICFCYSGLNAQKFNVTKMDSLFKRIEKHEKGMGSISIFNDGRQVYRRSIGFSDLGERTRATGETVYRIGSISKTFTATIILQLVDDKKIKLKTTLDDYFPQIPNAKKITIEDLLRHSSGIFNFTDNPEYFSWMEEPKGQQEILSIIAEGGSIFEPGEKHAYSNSNYVLLSLIAEKVEEKKFSQILTERITKPLGLKRTYYGGKIDPEKGEAFSYISISARQPATETDMSVPMGAGAIVSTADEINMFYKALFEGRLLSSKSLDRMQTIEDGYGMGIFSFPFHEKTALGHTGGIDGFQSNAAWFPDEKLAICYLANAVEMPVNDIMIGALSIYFDKDYQLPEFSQAITVSTEILKKYEGTYSSEALPIQLKIFVENGTLFGQGTGQPPFPLEASEENKFRFEPAGVVIHFSPEHPTLTLFQGGSEFQMTKNQD